MRCTVLAWFNLSGVEVGEDDGKGRPSGFLRYTMVEVGKTLFISKREDWRLWLQENHNTEKEIWLIHYRKGTVKASLQYGDAVEEALWFGWIDGILKKRDEESYVVRYSPRTKKSIWSETNKKRVRKLIKQGRMTEAGMAKIEEAKKNGEWDKATEREDITAIPVELKRALSKNRMAKAKWDTYS